MTDRREEIFVRLEAVLKTVSGATVKRMETTFDPESELPGIALLDGNEQVQESSHGGVADRRIDLQPVIALFIQTSDKAGTGLNALRVKVLKALLFDAQLAALCSSERNGRIDYLGCETDSQLAEAILADMIMNFQLTYVFKPAAL